MPEARRRLTFFSNWRLITLVLIILILFIRKSGKVLFPADVKTLYITNSKIPIIPKRGGSYNAT